MWKFTCVVCANEWNSFEVNHNLFSLSYSWKNSVINKIHTYYSFWKINSISNTYTLYLEYDKWKIQARIFSIIIKYYILLTDNHIDFFPLKSLWFLLSQNKNQNQNKFLFTQWFFLKISMCSDTSYYIMYFIPTYASSVSAIYK